MARAPGFSGSISAWVRAHPIGAFCIWFFPVAWTIAMLPVLSPRPFGMDIPLEVFLSGATLIGGLLPVVVITAVLFALQHLPLFVQTGLMNVAGLVFLAAFIVLAIPFRALTGWLYNRTGSVFLVGLLHAAGDATTSGSFDTGFLPRLYDNDGISFFHMLAFALIGLVVIAATRARLGRSARLRAP